MYEKQEYILLNRLAQLDLFQLLESHHAIIAGGAIRSIFAGEFISDYDVYFKTANDMYDFASKLKDKKFELAFSTDVALSYKKDDVKLQIIQMPDLICQNPVDVINQFDYTVCMAAFDFDTKSFVLNENFLNHLARREMYFNVNGKYPLASLFRLKKYMKKGYTISGAEIIKLGLAINNLKMNNYLDLKRQLQGIDTLFLVELTDKLMSPEYAEKAYDFNVFMNLIEEHFQDKLDELFE